MSYINIHKDAGTELFHGHKTIGTTRAKLIDTPLEATKGVVLRCPGATDPTANTAPVWVGGPDVTADSSADSGGVPIVPGSAVSIPIDDPSKLYVISTAAGQDISWMVIK